MSMNLGPEGPPSFDNIPPEEEKEEQASVEEEGSFKGEGSAVEIEDAGDLEPDSDGHNQDLSEYLKMYEVSGQDQITPHSLERYNRDREQVYEILEKARTAAPFWRKKILLANEEDRANVIRDGFSTEDPAVHKACSAMIWAAPEEERDELRKQLSNLAREGFAGEDIDAQKEYAWTIWDAAIEDRAEIIAKGMKSEVNTVSESIARMIEHAPQEDRATLIRSGLESDNSALWKTCARQIWSVPDAEQVDLLEMVVAGIQDGLTSAETPKQKAAAQMIEFAPEEERPHLREQLSGLLLEVFEGDDAEKIKELSSVIAQTPENNRHQLFALAQDKLGDKLVEHPLYKDTAISKERFSRTDFDKTGSETMLFGGETKDKMIMRRIQPESFLVWQRVFEDYELWENAGFDYVPIEPIIAFRLNKDGFVDTFNGLLDLSLDEWEGMGGEHVDELKEERKKIMTVFEKMGINHGHYHDANFCLRFFRDENGKADLTRKPRIYLIDFDQAQLPMAAFGEEE